MSRKGFDVEPQCASWLGKTANCEPLVSVTLVSCEAPMIVGFPILLPESRIDNLGLPSADNGCAEGLT
jgi:hypothetical protein